MFIVNSDLQYINHFTSTQEIADAVKDDLASRRDCEHPELVAVENTERTTVRWDPGGVLMGDDEPFVFDLNEMRLEVLKQHFSYFVRCVNESNLREWFDTQYYKIHSGYICCICITPAEFENLKNQISNPDLAWEASLANERKQSAVESSFTQAVKMEDDKGNPIVMEVKRKPHILN